MLVEEAAWNEIQRGSGRAETGGEARRARLLARRHPFPHQGGSSAGSPHGPAPTQHPSNGCWHAAGFWKDCQEAVLIPPSDPDTLGRLQFRDHLLRGEADNAFGFLRAKRMKVGQRTRQPFGRLLLSLGQKQEAGFRASCRGDKLAVGGLCAAATTN
jgi:hypothetical protein